MNSRIITVHEEEYSDNSRVLGMLLNLNENNEKIDSFPYFFKNGIYVFFDTIIDMIDYIIYNDKKINRSYLKEEDFDALYDESFDGAFSEYLQWTTPPDEEIQEA